MTYAIEVDVAAPVEMYDALHAEVIRRSGGTFAGLLVHIGRATATGFQVLEIWETEDQFQQFNVEVLWPVMAELAGDSTAAPPAHTTEQFDVHGLILTGAERIT